MNREIMWSPWDTPGLEHLHLTLNEDGVIADGEIMTTLFEERPMRLRYHVECDAGWRVRGVRVTMQAGQRSVDLRSDGAGQWTTSGGDILPALDGCIDVDIMATPFTNTLPIRRLGLQPGESADLNVAYISVPSLEAVMSPQRYTCLESRPDGGLYRYQSVSSGYTNDLPVDADGLVIDYPGIWRRVWPVNGKG
jgi:hypothetical protein